MAFSCMECMRRFSQIVLIIINIIVVLMGLATMAIGIWAKINDRTYFEIANNQSIAQLSILLIIVGLFIMIVGAVGAVGAIFGNTIFGRITLGLYSVVLTLLVICEIAAGIAAAIKRNELESLFRSGTNNTFVMKQGGAEWNTYEKQVKKFLFKCLNIVPYSGKLSRGLIFTDRQSANILQFNFVDAPNRADTCMYKSAYFMVYESTVKSTKDCTPRKFPAIHYACVCVPVFELYVHVLLQLHCCGPESWRDYDMVLNKDVIPESCCNPTNRTRYDTCMEAKSEVRNSTTEQQAKDYLFQTGCASVVIDGVRHNLGAIAGGAIVLGLFQITGIVMACFVAVYKRDDNKYEVV